MNRVLTICLFFMTMLPSIGFAEAPKVIISQDTSSVKLSNYIEILPDLDASLTIDDIINNDYNFQPVAVIGDNFGFTKTAYWVRFTTHDIRTTKTPLLLEVHYPLLDDITFFIPSGKNHFIHKKTGDRYPFSQRDVNHRNYVFDLPVSAENEITYYLRIQSDGSLRIPLFLWKPNAYIEYVDTSSLALGMYYGVMWLLVITSLISYIKIRDVLFLTYAFYLITYLYFQSSMNGYTFQFVLFDLPLLSNRSTSVSVNLVTISALIFTGKFLQIWSHKHQWGQILFSIVLIAAFIGILLSLFGEYKFAIQYSTVIAILLPPLVIATTINSVLSGYKPARFFLIAWGIFLVSVFISGLLHLGLITATFLTTYSIQIGSLIEIIVIAYALIVRLDLLRAEKNDAILRANDYLNQINHGLESMVAERTQQLKEKNKELSDLAMHDAMTGLFNHNASLEYLDKMRRSAQRYKKELAIIMIDIDLFKSINDTFGHVAGDKVITEISSVLKTTIRESDICGRFGGEEFIVILPESDLIATQDLAERIRVNIQNLTIAEIENKPVTASLGIAVYNMNAPQKNLLAEADDALYKAKQSGRNQVQVSV